MPKSSVKQIYRGNPAEKLYEFLSDFSGGINSKLEDSLINDNQSRNISNFDIVAGGLLTKRKGFAAIDLNNFLSTITSLHGVDINSITVNDSVYFSSDENDVLSLSVITNDSNAIKKIINIIFYKTGSVKKVTVQNLGQFTVISESFGDHQMLLIDEVDSNNKKFRNVFVWNNDKWIDFKSILKSSQSFDDNINAIENPAYLLFTTLSVRTQDYRKRLSNTSLDKIVSNEISDSDKSTLRKKMEVFRVESSSHSPNDSGPSLRVLGPYSFTNANSPYNEEWGQGNVFNVRDVLTAFFKLPKEHDFNKNFIYTFDEDTLDLEIETQVPLSIVYPRRQDRRKYASMMKIFTFKINKDDIAPGITDPSKRKEKIKDFLIKLYSGRVGGQIKYISWKRDDDLVDSPIPVTASLVLIDINDVDDVSRWSYGTGAGVNYLGAKYSNGLTKTIYPKNSSNNFVTFGKNELFATNGDAFSGNFDYDNPPPALLDFSGTDSSLDGRNTFGSDPRIQNFVNMMKSGPQENNPLFGFPNYGTYIRKYVSSVDLSYVVNPAEKFEGLTRKYIPNSFSMQNLSYNLLTLNENFDFENVNSPDSDKFRFDETSEVPDIGGIILLNGYYAQTNIEGIYKVSLNLPVTETRSDWHIGYTIMPIEQWTKIQASPNNNAEYIKQVIAPAFAPDANGNTKTSIIKFTPRTSSQYVISAFSFKEDSSIFNPGNTSGPMDWLNKYVDHQVGNNAPIKIDFILSATSNINVSETYGVKSSPNHVIENFYKTNKSITFKNQMIVYGGSNSFFISDVNNFSYFPMLNNFQVPTESPIVSMVTYFDSIIIATERQQFVLTGNSPESFRVNELNNDIGVVAPKTVKNNSNFIFQLTAEGVYKVKTLFNFHDRYNVEKVDDAVAGDILPKKDSSAVVFNNKYYLCLPTEKTMWIYYNDYKSWIKYESEIFKGITKLHVINHELYLIGNGLNIYKVSGIIPNEHGEGGYKDSDMHGNTYPITSIYKSKEIDFGLPNHDKKFKKLHTRFADTPGKNELFMNVWVDSTLWVTPDNVVVEFDQTSGQVVQKIRRDPSVVTVARTIHDLPNSKYSSQINNIGNKYDEDLDQLHEIVVAARGRQIQFEVVHTEDKRLNIKNFANLIKIKKPKALRTTSKKL